MREIKNIRKAKNENPRTFGFIHIGEIIPGVLRDVEKKFCGTKCPTESHNNKNTVGILGGAKSPKEVKHE